MSLPTFTAKLGLPSPTDAPLTVTELVNLLNTLFLPVSIANYNAQIVTGSSVPGVGDQDKLWFKTDTAGRPLGFFSFYNGSWRRLYSGQLNQVSLYSGVPNHDFDSTGLGLINQTWDGWALMNGQNGTTDISDKFIVSAHMNESGGINQYNAGWQTTVSGTAHKTGGSKDHLVTEGELPTYDLTITGFHPSDTNPGAGNAVAIVDNHGTTEYTVDLGTQYGVIPPAVQAAIPTLPPYLALAYAQFIGYA